MSTKKLQIIGKLGGGSSIQLKNIILPAGRAKGDVNGDGVIDHNDAAFVMQNVVGSKELFGVDLWAADMDGDGEVREIDATLILDYIAEDFSNISDILYDYYGNWTWDNVKHRYYYDVVIENITSSYSATLLMDKIMDQSIVIEAECMNGFIRVYVTCVPVVDINCSIVYSSVGGKTIVVGSQNMLNFSEKIDDTLTKEGFAADAKATGDAITNLNNLVGDTSVSEQIAEALNDANVNIGVDASLSTEGMAADAKATGSRIAAVEARMFECLTENEYNALKAAGKLNENTPYLIIEG